MNSPALVRSLDAVGSADTASVGGKNASLGEMIANLAEAGIRVPPGFATTADAYWDFLEHNELEERIAGRLESLKQEEISLDRAGRSIRQMIYQAKFPPELEEAIGAAYEALGETAGRQDPAVAVRSSATAEDLPEASFAGQQESFLNVTGREDLLKACRRCFASLFTDRAIAYREKHGFEHMKVALSVGVQLMVRADTAGAGVMFSIDTETGFEDVVLINAAWGLGEAVVGGLVDPDEYMVFKPLLDAGDCCPIIEKELGSKRKRVVYSDGGDSPTRQEATPPELRQRFVLDDEEICRLARWAIAIEDHYGQPMDIEWAKDGETGELLIVQARPETVQSQQQAASLKTYSVRNPGKKLLTGLAIGDGAAAGAARVLTEQVPREAFPEGGILVTTMTDPDWVPIMRRAAAIVTDRGGRTSHAAIVSRELGVPAIVGAGDATSTLEDRQAITVSCAEGDQGAVYQGEADIEVEEADLEDIPATDTLVMLILANPAASLRWWRLPSDGVGLARMEFIINNAIKIHPLALAGYDELEDESLRERIDELTPGWDDKAGFFVDRLARGIARIAASQYPERVVVRLSDFKTNEYAQLVGGEAFEPEEPNPMLGWRGASRYYSEEYRPGFELECRALVMLRDEIGLDNVTVMVPFCRTPAEADRVLEILAEQGVTGDETGTEVYVMCEVPSNVIEAEAFAQRFDGFSIGSNDLTQLVLGIDRDSERLAGLFDESELSVRRMIASVIEQAHARGRPVGLCGQAPSDDPEFARFLVEAGIDSISVSPDSYLAVKRVVAEAEAQRDTREQE
ncbi:phosphoenolpyruvate synthase [Thioalkalivibrio sp. XN8]|uniref:phosphoenolpyruvate synthase n=1 Tax=Thioalkalivibrio sp. XN8 TaxID=2712863 RepID=UPI0013EA67A2|nr:phosphoenolpyruvate synthase [Thioalkalivibrio sp. XN8]NGP54488.1 phosphoenolpyruvate synthase [Thioalkalivibrio sp. XN8]